MQHGRLDALTWDEHTPEAFAGFHNAGRRIIYGFDESAAIASSIFQESEGILAGAEDTEIIWLCSVIRPGSTPSSGRSCRRLERASLEIMHIDTRHARMSDKNQIQEWIDAYGSTATLSRPRSLAISARRLDAIHLDRAGRAGGKGGP